MDFLKWKGDWIKSLLFAGLVFGIVFFLYGIPVGPALYGFLLIFGIDAFFLLFAYLKYRRKKEELWNLKEKVRAGDESFETRGENYFEEEYRRLIKELQEEGKRKQEEWRREEKRDREYYTRWNHQIKTPIAAVRLLLSEKEPDLRSVKREMFRIEQYADMALSYQRMAGEENDLLLKPVQLEKLVRQTLKKLTVILVSKKLQVKLTDLNREFVTDEKWMCFILEQILTNAAKYTREGGRIEIGIEGEQLLIRDNGIGIQAEDLPRIFEWGYTGYNGRLDKRSTGIGLALTKQAAGMLKIPIAVTSRVGEGTKVALTLAQAKLEGD